MTPGIPTELRDRWSTHFAWSSDQQRILGSTPTGRATVAALRMNRPQLANLRRIWTKLDGVFP
jgi:hypothetical protein